MIETIQTMLDQEPFTPFQIVLSSGDRYEVKNPRLVVIGVSTVFFCYPHSDRVAFLRSNQIASVETTPHAA